MRLQSCKIVPNPFEKCHSIQKDEIEEILKLGPILNDDSQVSKIRDEFAFGLFNLDNSSTLLKSSTFENFFYIFISGCWVEQHKRNFSKDKNLFN